MPLMNRAHQHASVQMPDRIDDAAVRRLARIDLNLLVVFAALMQDRSVTTAASRLFVGQSAVSAALKRLRLLFGDPLLVKQGRGMVATERALELQSVVGSTLVAIDSLVSQPMTFDAASSQATFRIGLSDDNEIVFLPAIVRALRIAAPQARVVARAVSHQDIRERLDLGEIDIGISVFGELSSWHCSEVLFEQGYGCLFDPKAWKRRTALTLDDYLHSRQVIVTFDGELRGRIDDVLRERGLQRQVAYGTTRFAPLAHWIQGTDMVASLPELIGRVLASSHGLRYSPMPLQIAPGKPRMAWHRRNHLDPSNRWIRNLITTTVKEVVELTRRKRLKARTVLSV